MHSKNDTKKLKRKLFQVMVSFAKDTNITQWRIVFEIERLGPILGREVTVLSLLWPDLLRLFLS